MQTQDRQQEVWEKAVMINIAIYQALLAQQEVIGHTVDVEYGLPGLLDRAKNNLPPEGLYNRLELSVEPIDPGIGKEGIEQILVRRIEALLVLLWILGEVDQLSDLQAAPMSINGLVKKYAAIKPTDASTKHRMRSWEAIESARDESWLWLWRTNLEKNVRSKLIKTPERYERLLLANTVHQITNELGFFRKAVGGDYPFEGKAFRKISRIQLRKVETRLRVRLYILSWVVGKISDWNTRYSRFRSFCFDVSGHTWTNAIVLAPEPYF